MCLCSSADRELAVTPLDLVIFLFAQWISSYHLDFTQLLREVAPAGQMPPASGP